MMVKEKLNDNQLAAVKTANNRALVIAGAGSGKTRVLTHRIEELINQGASAYSILALTFTRRAAGEMKERLAGMLTDRDVRKMEVSTFHSVCLRIVREIGELLGYRRNLSIYDDIDRRDVLAAVIGNLGLRRVSVKAAVAYLEATAAGEALHDDDFLKLEQLKSAIREYRNILRQYNALDYTGLLEAATHLLENYPNAREHYGNIWRHVLVDEFQDTDELQVRFLRALAPETLFMVGDYRQSIYQWRGARPQLLFDFSEEQGAARFDLSLNYRSVPEILELANRVIDEGGGGRYGKSLEPVRVSGSELQVEACRFEDMVQEAEFIVERISCLVQDCGYGYRDIVVLARTNRMLEGFAQWLRDSGREQDMPFVRIGKMAEFWKKEEVRLCVNILKLLHNPHNNQALKSIFRTLKIEIPDIKLHEWQARRHGVPLVRYLAAADEPGHLAQAGAFCDVIGRYGRNPSLSLGFLFGEAVNAWDVADFYRQRMLTSRVENIRRAGDHILDRGGDLEGFLEWHAFRDLQDELEGARHEDKVKLMTVHAAKGLEFPVVFLMNVVDGQIPHRRSNYEEERRLFYVAVTRAADSLIITSSLTGENGKPQEPSPFMANCATGAAK